MTNNVFDRSFSLDDNHDMNLCSGRPVGAVTTLRNGTMIVFRGECEDKYVKPYTRLPNYSMSNLFGKMTMMSH